jgi:hypothetical protein
MCPRAFDGLSVVSITNKRSPTDQPSTFEIASCETNQQSQSNPEERRVLRDSAAALARAGRLERDAQRASATDALLEVREEGSRW